MLELSTDAGMAGKADGGTSTSAMRPELSFFTPGDKWPHNDSYIFVNQAYVQYLPPVGASPENLTQKTLPILFIHGGGLTGSIWEATPDRRPGWAIIATRPPFSRPVYLLDAVDSGRSQRCPNTVRSDESYEHRKASEVWERFRLGDMDGFTKNPKEPYPGSQFPVQHFDNLVRSQSARCWGKAQNEAEIAGVSAAIREVGPCHVIAHSNGGGLSCEALCRDENLRKLVHSLVLVEPSKMMGDSLDVKPVRSVVVWGDYLDDRYSRMRGLIKQYEEGLPNPELWNLPGRFGISGNTHFPMCDRNSADVMHMILRWLDDQETARLTPVLDSHTACKDNL